MLLKMLWGMVYVSLPAAFWKISLCLLLPQTVLSCRSKRAVEIEPTEYMQNIKFCILNSLVIPVSQVSF